MVGLIPEKTVEVWTACSLLAILGQRTRIWSPAASYDQGVWLDEWADVLVKWFVLELKAPKCGHGPIGQNTLHDCRDPHINIDLPQLAAYVAGIRRRPPAHPEVLYVLPDTPWRKITGDGAVLPDAAHPDNRQTFPEWSFVIPATRLDALLSSTRAKKTATVRCRRINSHLGKVEYTGRRRYTTSRFVGSLQDFLLGVRGCDEPTGRALRSRRLPARAPRYEPEDDRELIPEDLVLTGDSLRQAMAALGESRSRHILYVGTTESR